MSSTSEYFNSNATKRTATTSSALMKLRPSVLNSPAHVMSPSNLNLPWSPCEMSWAMQPTSSGVVEFRGQSNNPLLCKRKAADGELYMKPKKLITEEKMAEHLQGLHISPNFTSHCTGTLEDCSSDSLSMESESSSSSTDCPYTITSTQDLEQKLRNAQRITICEQIRKLQNEPVIPQAILSRFERPSTALVLWQPPAKLTELIATVERERKGRNDDEHEQVNNNSNSSIDFNNSMDLDL